MSSPEGLQDYIKREMRFVPKVRVRQSFKVDRRGHDFRRDPQATPIIINNYNRLEYLVLQIEALRERGYENIYIIDNASTYEPLFEYYRNEKLRVFYLDSNVGYLALWRTPIGSLFTQNYYVYTDPDVIPVADCPADFMSLFFSLLEAASAIRKAGFGLKIDDLPEHNPLRDQIISHESQFWRRPVDAIIYAAPIDTTFALYRPRSIGGWWLPAYRTAGVYIARHAPWYEDPEALTEEGLFHRAASVGGTHWSDISRRTIADWPPSDLLPWTTNTSLHNARASDAGVE